jgi:lauroyl/myristoyl acyltransferase
MTLDGVEHLSRATAEGKGAVLWLADMSAATDVTQQALFSAGFPLAHMTRPEHGFSPSAFGVACLNPFKRRFEQRFLGRHIVYDRAQPQLALDEMAAVLRAGGVLSILATTYEGRALAEAGFLGGRARVAAGPPRLALDAGCEILPVFVLPGASPGDYRCVVQKPLSTVRGDARKAALQAAGDYLYRLEAAVRDNPAAWRCWGDLHFDA